MEQHRSYVQYSLTRQSKAKAVIKLLPCGTNINVRREGETALRPFTIEDVKTWVETLKNWKAPRTNGVPLEIIKKIGMEKPHWLTEFLNQCLCRQIFPTSWKVAKLILIPEGTTEPDSEETKYRPICLLNSISNLHEALIKGRLESHIEDIHGISENQFGFRKRMLTIQAIGKEKLPGRSRDRHFADNLALTVRPNSEYELKHKAEIAMEIVENWMEENGLPLTKHKTVTVVLKGPRNEDNIVIRAGETSLQPGKHQKYLGITLSGNGDNREHK
ncbi:hypothetical protein JTB14_017951 [Gonioctena quinquepunctata]|nr:hypothetical protein JTB14_017951 [Gonioctena quinquepunctata]